MKILSIKSLGVQKVYSPEMSSDQHNYITEESQAVHKNSHGVSYCLMALRSLWLKRHFAPEFWAAVMSDCHPDKLVRYMGIARSEGWTPTDITRLGSCEAADDIESVEFGTLNLRNLTSRFTVTGNVVNQGMIGIKGIGVKAAKKFEGKIEFVDIDDFVAKKGGKNKLVLERFIKLGAFRGIPGHENAKALWDYYQYKYCTGTNITQLKQRIRSQLLVAAGWTDAAVLAERKRQTDEYRKAYPNRKKIPNKILNWKPKPVDSLENIISLYDTDFTLSEILEFEKEYLGYYLHSPLGVYDVRGGRTFEAAKTTAGEATIEAVVSDFQFADTKTGKKYGRIYLNDGIQTVMVFIWPNELHSQPPECLMPGVGVQLAVEYDKSRGTFALPRGEIIMKLLRKGWSTVK